MRISRVTLQDVISRNYEHIASLDVDIKSLVSNIENNYTANYQSQYPHHQQHHKNNSVFKRNYSYKTIEEGGDGGMARSYSPKKIVKKLSYEMVKMEGDRGEAEGEEGRKEEIKGREKYKRKGSFMSRFRKTKQQEQSPNKDKNDQKQQPKGSSTHLPIHHSMSQDRTQSLPISKPHLDSKKLHRFLFQMDLPSVNPEQKPKRTKFTILPNPSPTPTTSQPTTKPHHLPQSVKLIRKYQNQQLPAFLRHHLESNQHKVSVEPELVRRAMSMMRIKRKNQGRGRVGSLPPTKSEVELGDRGIRPEVVELRVVDLKSRNERRGKEKERGAEKDRKVKMRENIVNRKIVSSLKRYQEGVQGGGELCGWNVQE